MWGVGIHEIAIYAVVVVLVATVAWLVWRQFAKP